MIPSRRFQYFLMTLRCVLVSVLMASLPAWAARAPIPDKAAQNRSMQLVKELYREDFLSAKSAEAKVKLAQSMLGSAADFQSDHAGAYVLMRVARDIAVGAGNISLAMDAINQMSRRFEQDATTMKLKAAITVAESATASQERKAVAEVSVLLLRQAIAADEYELADRLAKLAATAARRARALDVAHTLDEMAKQTARLAADFKSVQSALATLNQQPDNPDANKTVGHFMCFVKGDWESGLSYLALSGDEELKELAATDLSGASDWKSQIAIADRWWDFAQRQKGTAQENSLRRAAHWYLQAKPQTEGLQKAKVDQRLAAVQKDLGEQPIAAAGGAVPKFRYQAVKSNLIGKSRRTPFDEVAPQGAYLVGFRVLPGTAFGGSIDAIQPVYRQGKRTLLGRAYGRGKSAPVDLVAKPNYAVGELKAQSGLLIDGFRIVFMRVTDGALDPSDSYESPWVGGTGGSARNISANGSLITGVYGSIGNRLEGLGLILRQRVFDQNSTLDPNQTPNAAGWTTIFRSSNPAIWNTDFVSGNEVAMSVAKVPDNIRFLRLTMIGSRPQQVIVPMQKNQLTADWQQGTYGWNGQRRQRFGGYHLGVYLNERVDVRGEVHVGSHHEGWGFGHIHHGGDLPGGYQQGYSWAGQRIQNAVFEIAVKSVDLDQAEIRYLLR